MQNFQAQGHLRFNVTRTPTNGIILLMVMILAVLLITGMFLSVLPIYLQTRWDEGTFIAGVDRANALSHLFLLQGAETD